MKKHLYFTGFMASGKSRTGRALADRLGRPFVDTDNVIVERAGKSINEIFEQDGEAAFRKMERDVIAQPLGCFVLQDASPHFKSNQEFFIFSRT